MPYIPYLPYIPNIPSPPHHRGRSHMGAIYGMHPMGGRGAGRGWCIYIYIYI